MPSRSPVERRIRMVVVWSKTGEAIASPNYRRTWVGAIGRSIGYISGVSYIDVDVSTIVDIYPIADVGVVADTVSGIVTDTVPGVVTNISVFHAGHFAVVSWLLHEFI
jgi:hypothetical protein